MAPINRELSISYGALTVGGTSGRYLLDSFEKGWQSDEGFESGFVEFDFIVVAESEVSFVSACAFAEKQLRKPDLTVFINQGSSVRFRGGFNARPRFSKTGGTSDTGRSTQYHVRIEFEMPADNTSTGFDGLRESQINVSAIESGRRTLRISGTVAKSSARSVYDAAIDAYAAAAISGIGGTFELIGTPESSEDRTGNILTFDRTYQELVFGDVGSSGLDDTDIVNQALTIGRRDELPGDTLSVGAGGATSAGGAVNVRRLAIVDVTYIASIATGKTPKSKYESSIRGGLLKEIERFMGTGNFALTREVVSDDTSDDNQLRVAMTAEAAADGQEFVERRFTTRDEYEAPEVFLPIWTGEPLDVFRYKGEARLFRRVTESYVKVGNISLQDAAANAVTAAGNISSTPNTPGAGGGGRFFIVAGPNVDVTPIRKGTPGGKFIDLTEVNTEVVRRYVIVKSSGAGSSGPVTAPRG